MAGRARAEGPVMSRPSDGLARTLRLCRQPRRCPYPPWRRLPRSRDLRPLAQVQRSRGRYGRADADHVLKGSSQAQPSGKRVHGLAGEQPPARWVGARLKLESDAHRRLLVHTRQLRRPSGVAASRRHRCFLLAAAAVLFRVRPICFSTRSTAQRLLMCLRNSAGGWVPSGCLASWCAVGLARDPGCRVPVMMAW